MDDPRTLNKILYLRPAQNIYSFNELVALWEKKIGKTLEKVYVPEEKLLKDIEGLLNIDVQNLNLDLWYSYIDIPFCCRVSYSNQCDIINQPLCVREG